MAIPEPSDTKTNTRVINCHCTIGSIESLLPLPITVNLKAFSKRTGGGFDLNFLSGSDEHKKVNIVETFVIYTQNLYLLYIILHYHDLYKKLSCERNKEEFINTTFIRTSFSRIFNISKNTNRPTRQTKPKVTRLSNQDANMGGKRTKRNEHKLQP